MEIMSYWDCFLISVPRSLVSPKMDNLLFVSLARMLAILLLKVLVEFTEFYPCEIKLVSRLEPNRRKPLTVAYFCFCMLFGCLSYVCSGDFSMDTELSLAENESEITAILLFCCVSEDPELTSAVANFGRLPKAGEGYCGKSSELLPFISFWTLRIRSAGDS